jgi:ATP-dependent Clp protease protease subunit
MFLQWFSKFILVTAIGISVLGTVAILDSHGGPTNKEINGTNLTNESKNIKSTTPTDLKDKSLEKGKYKVSQLDLNSRIVYIYGEINESSAPLVASSILKLSSSSEPMYIFIDSPGGSVISGAAIISAMEAAKGPVNTVCVQLCASMAAMIHQYGTNRLMLNRAFLMFHPASGGVDGEVDKAFSRLGTMRRFIGKMEENVATRSSISYDDYKRKSGVELWLDAEDAFNSKFADKIIYIRGSDAEKLFNNPAVAPSDNKGPTIPFVVPATNVKTFDIMWE